MTTTSIAEAPSDDCIDLIWGARAIAKRIRRSEHQTFYLLSKGYIPARKIGDSWVVSERELRKLFAAA